MTGQPDRHEAGQTDHDRYRSYRADDGSLVLYDGQNDDAWVQSNTTVDLRP